MPILYIYIYILWIYLDHHFWGALPVATRHDRKRQGVQRRTSLLSFSLGQQLEEIGGGKNQELIVELDDGNILTGKPNI